MRKKKLAIQDYCLIAVCTAIIAILSQVTIPMPYGVPMTLQTFVVPLAGVILGAKRGAITAAVYVLLGAIGLPVFAGFSGGVGMLFGMTGGFILAFPAMAYLAGAGAARGSAGALVVGLLSAVLVEYTAGLLMFMLVTGSSLGVSFAACVLPFLPTEAVKAVLVGILGGKCKSILVRGGVLAA